MERVDIADFKDRLADLAGRAEAGETIDLHRDGKPVARIVPTEPVKTKIDIEALRALRASMPYQEQSAADLIRQMRDSGY